MEDFDFEEQKFDFDFETEGFDVDLSAEEKTETGFCKPKAIKPQCVKYDNAIKLSDDLILSPGMNYYCIVSGNFIFGDLIEAVIINKKLKVNKLSICTLSMSENNVDSLVNIMLSGLCAELHLTLSSYFFAHERNGLIKYIYQELKQYNFHLSVAGTHMKTALIETDDMKLVMQGSANLRSSRNIEQFSITDDSGLYDFNMDFINTIEKTYIINKDLRGDKLWREVQKQAQPEVKSVRV